MKAKLLTAVILALIFARAAFSGTLTLTFETTDTPGVQVWLSTPTTMVVDGIWMYAGKFRAIHSETDPYPGLPPAFDSYCVDILHSFDDTTILDNDNLMIRPMSEWEQTNLLNPSEKWPSPPRDGYPQQAAAYLYSKNWASASGNKMQEAALQISLWEVLYEGSNRFNVRDGYISFFSLWSEVENGPTILDLATDYLNQLAGADVSTASAYWLETEDYPNPEYPDWPYTQDFIAPVPEPGSIALLGSGVLGLALLAWRRAK